MPPPRPSLLRLFARQFHSPLIDLLVAAAPVSLGLGHRPDASLIGVVLLINALIGTIQKIRPTTAFSALRDMIGHCAMVCRAGATSVADARDLVVGDIAECNAGIFVERVSRVNYETTSFECRCACCYGSGRRVRWNPEGCRYRGSYDQN